jgi:hypothetical protein
LDYVTRRFNGTFGRGKLDRRLAQSPAVKASSTIQPQQKMKAKNMTTLHLRKSNGRSPLRLGFLLITVLVLACFAPLPMAQATDLGGVITNFGTADGTGVLVNQTTGNFNSGFGASALASDTSGFSNSAFGASALALNKAGSNNSAFGVEALELNTGDNNTAIGSLALFSNDTGVNNTAIGLQALVSNISGFDNVANGTFALFSNTTAGNNTANGFAALSTDTDGEFNTVNGAFAMFNNSHGSDNTANGLQALFSNTTGGDNTADGTFTLFSNTTGFNNTAYGFAALINNTQGSNNTVLGAFAGNNLTTGSNNIDIANAGNAGENNIIRIGTAGTQVAAFIAGITGTAVSGTAVVVSSSGQLGVAASSARFKDEIKPMEKASESILALKPVTFRYKKEIDPKGIPQFGLVAEQVEKVNPDLVVRDAEGKVFTIRYDAVNAMLLNEFLKEHCKVEEQEAAITKMKSASAKQEAIIAHQQKQIEALATGLQRVSAQLEVSKPAPQTVANNQ